MKNFLNRMKVFYTIFIGVHWLIGCRLGYNPVASFLQLPSLFPLGALYEPPMYTSAQCTPFSLGSFLILYYLPIQKIIIYVYIYITKHEEEVSSKFLFTIRKKGNQHTCFHNQLHMYKQIPIKLLHSVQILKKMDLIWNSSSLEQGNLAFTEERLSM